MMVDLSFLLILRPHPVDEGVQQDLNPGNHLGEDQPQVDHLHVGRLWKAAWHADEQGGQDEQGGEVHGDDSLWKVP